MLTLDTVHGCHGGEYLVSSLTLTMSPLTTASLGLCLVLCLLLRPWESGLVVAACCLLLRWEAGRVASLGNTTHPHLLVIMIPCREGGILTESQPAPAQLRE